MTTFFAGDELASADLNTSFGLIGTVIKRGRRTTAKTNVGATELPVLRIDDCPVTTGHIYAIMVTNANTDVNTANDVMIVPVRVVQSASTGTQATITSTQIASIRVLQANITDSTKIPAICFYPAASTGFLSILLSVQRTQGSGTTNQLFCSGTDILDLVVFDLGLDPGDSGVVL